MPSARVLLVALEVLVVLRLLHVGDPEPDDLGPRVPLGELLGELLADILGQRVQLGRNGVDLVDHMVRRLESGRSWTMSGSTSRPGNRRP